MERIAQSGTEERHNFLVDIALQSRRQTESSNREPKRPDIVQLLNLDIERKSQVKQTRSTEIASTSTGKSNVASSFSIPFGTKFPEIVESDEGIEEPIPTRTLTRNKARRAKVEVPHES